MSYPGGKAQPGVYQRLINQIPPHHTFISAFLGHCAVTRYKRPATRTIGLDLATDALDHWRDNPIPGLELLHTNALTYLPTHFQLHDYPPRTNWPPDLLNTVVYLDPPYPPETRSNRKIYANEMSLSNHVTLLQICLRLPCPVIITSYWTPTYAEFLTKWRSFTYAAMTRGGCTRTETVWTNYPEPAALHDYRHIGTDKRDRERIRRRAANWARILATLPHHERAHVLETLTHDPEQRTH